MKNLTLLIFFLSSCLAFSQSSDNLFSMALSQNIRKYNIQSDDAYENRDLERGKSLFDSLVKNHLRGTILDNYRFKRFEDDSYFRLNTIHKPFVLLTTASWCVVPEDQIAAINLLADEYADQVEFIILFWDRVGNILDLSLQYSEKIPVIYFDEKYNRDPQTIKTLKHSLGLPLCFYADQDRKIIDITRGGVFLPYDTKEDLYSINYNVFKNSVDNLIAHSAVITEPENESSTTE
ncbi:TlpA family protein disulfide reductase [Abyssalbus ytuae]|uniref:TlpA family protein disulfide reductase n=1 Tax=Abyssalbus ytuae TaxID=2926907 RepID=A0A9E7A1X5_9FLAO|nr:TlpA family protein disulfide reductase [Abyssalbus ytuae]UOB18231.1 TlpA family protein disulfide reductase [Abyssalbus ytuae]